MTGEPSDRVQALFDGAADLSGTERVAYLDAACGGDRALRAEVEELLAFDGHSTADMTGRGILRIPFVRLPENTYVVGPSAFEEKPPAIPGYEIEGVLGRGGMGVVYQARDLSLARTVALKLILAGGHAGEEERRRFKAEAEAVARLQHPNIVQIHAVGEHEGRQFCALEYVGGGSLAQRLASGSLPPAEAAALVETLARAVGLAHCRQIVHRDLKPANVLLTADGVPKVADFGLARRLDADGQQTQTGAAVGTPSYMAPEQAHGAAGPAADVYALGAILYECLTGRPPFKGSTAVETLDMVRREGPVAPRLLNPNVPRDLETVCLACLRKEPARRYPSAEALAEDLGRWRAGRPIAARPVGRLERATLWARRNPAVAGLLAAVAVSMLLGTSAATFFGIRATHKADLAEQERQRADGEARTNKDLAAKELAARLDAEAKGKLAGEKAEEARFEAARAGNALHANQLRQALRAWQENDLARVERALAEIEGPFREALEARFLRQVSRRRMRSLSVNQSNAGMFELAISGDGKRIFAATGWGRGSGEVKVWDAETGREQFAFKGHAGWVRCVSLSGDGTRAVSGGNDRTVMVWDADTGKERRTFERHAGVVVALALSGDGRWVVSADSARAVKLWEADTGKEKLSFVPHRGGVVGVAIDRDGGRIVTAGAEQATPDEIKVWDTATGKEKFSLRGHTAAINRLTMSADGRRIVSGDADGVVRVWDAQAGKELFVLRGHTAAIKAVATSADGKRIFSASFDDSVKIWDGETGKEQLTFRGLGGAVFCLAVTGDGKRVVSGGGPGIKILEPDAPPERLTLSSSARPGGIPGVWVAVTPDGKRVASARDATGVALSVWDAATGRERFARAAKGLIGVIRVAISADGTCVVTGSFDGTVRAWDGDTGAERFNVQGHTGEVCGVTAGGDGRRVYSASRDHTVKCWDARTGKELRTYEHAADVQCLALSGDGKWLVSGDTAGSVHIWNEETGERKTTLRGHKQGVICLAISRDGKCLVSADADEMMIWDLESGRAKRTLKGTANSVTFSADGKRIVSAGGAGLTFWDVETGLEKLTFPAHAGGVTSVALSDDDIITGGTDVTAKVWDVRQALE
jgi:WD40 repeat protein